LDAVGHERIDQPSEPIGGVDEGVAAGIVGRGLELLEAFN
jgi:hypothetical protein